MTVLWFAKYRCLKHLMITNPLVCTFLWMSPCAPVWVVWGHVTACGVAGWKRVDAFTIPDIVKLFSEDVVLVPLHPYPHLVPPSVYEAPFPWILAGTRPRESWTWLSGGWVELFLIGILFLFSWLLIKLRAFSYAYWPSGFVLLKTPFHCLWLFFSWVINF